MNKFTKTTSILAIIAILWQGIAAACPDVCALRPVALRDRESGGNSAYSNVHKVGTLVFHSDGTREMRFDGKKNGFTGSGIIGPQVFKGDYDKLKSALYDEIAPLYYKSVNGNILFTFLFLPNSNNVHFSCIVHQRREWTPEGLAEADRLAKVNNPHPSREIHVSKVSDDGSVYAASIGPHHGYINHGKVATLSLEYSTTEQHDLVHNEIYPHGAIYGNLDDREGSIHIKPSLDKKSFMRLFSKLSGVTEATDDWKTAYREKALVLQVRKMVELFVQSGVNRDKALRIDRTIINAFKTCGLDLSGVSSLGDFLKAVSAETGFNRSSSKLAASQI